MSWQVDRNAVVVVTQIVDDRAPHVAIDDATVKQDDCGRSLPRLRLPGPFGR
jgi:hypothetical protein